MSQVSMNSVYGFLGVARGGKQPCPAISAAVTAKGREYLQMAAEGAERESPLITGHPAHVRYGDTDSVMVDAFEHLGPLDTDEKRKEAVRLAFELGEELAERLSKLYKPPNKLEFEKVYMPWLLWEKKRYAGQMFSADLGWEKPKKTDYKGIQIVRSDIIPYVKDAIGEVMQAIMKEMSVTNAQRVAIRRAEEVLFGSPPVEQFIMSKKLSSSYRVVCTWTDKLFSDGEEKSTIMVSPSGAWRPLEGTDMARRETSGGSSRNQGLTCETFPGKAWTVLDQSGRPVGVVKVSFPHVHVALRKEARCPGSGEIAGDRVPYVFALRPPEEAPEGLQMETADDPAHLVEQKLPLDYHHYFEKCLRSPLESIFELFYKDPYAVLFKDLVRRYRNKRKRQLEISSFFQKS
jgi:DNA polymerase elongation subunit (family B)